MLVKTTCRLLTFNYCPFMFTLPINLFPVFSITLTVWGSYGIQ